MSDHHLTVSTVAIPLKRHLDRANDVGTFALGNDRAHRYYSECACGWRGPVCADRDQPFKEHAAHVKGEEAAA